MDVCKGGVIIIMLCHRHGYPWPSLATSPYHSSPLAGLQGCIPYLHIAAGCMFELVVLLLPGHMWGSIGVHHLWARPCFSSSDLHVWERKILWFTLPYNMAIANELGKIYFPPLSNQYKIFNKNNLKLSYPGIPNEANWINNSKANNLGISNIVSP